MLSLSVDQPVCTPLSLYPLLHNLVILAASFDITDEGNLLSALTRAKQ